jgi:hypothetical protein
MRRFISIFILSALYGFILSGCFARKVKQTGYITVKDTIITPPIVKLDTITQFNDRVIYLKDSTKQMFVTIERLKNNYIKVKAECEPRKIIVPVTTTITKTKEVIVKNLFWKYISLGLISFIVFFIVKGVLPKI